MLPDALGPTPAGVLPEGYRKDRIPLDSPDGPCPKFLPVFGDVQDVLHEDVYIDEHPTVLKVPGDVIFIIVIIVF